MQKPKIAISIGDINGISMEILLSSHNIISQFCEPYYFLHENLLKSASKLLNIYLDNLILVEFKNANNTKLLKQNNNIFNFYCDLGYEVNNDFVIKPGELCPKSGLYSFLSFKAATLFVKYNFAKALITLPINKKAWNLVNIFYKGHTEFLRAFFKQDTIMMLGCDKLFIALFTEHIALKEVSSKINIKDLSSFLIDLYIQTNFEDIAILAFNPHASDYHTIGGDEEDIIIKATKIANLYFHLKSKYLDKDKYLDFVLKDDNFENIKNYSYKKIFLEQPLVADSAFTPNSLKKYKYMVSLYHDLALAPLKALFFEESINVSLNLPIIRTSVDHGTAFDIAYKNQNPSNKSYINAIKYAIKNNHPIK